MTETRPVVLDPQPYEPYEDEIELMDLLKVLWKWKYLIIVGTLICAVGAAVVSLNMTKVYGITTVLQPGILKVTDDGKTVYIDSPQNISALIETGGLNGQVLKGVKFPENVKPPRSIGFEVNIPKNTNALEVTYETPYVDTGVHIMKNMNQSLLERYGKFVKLYEENYNNEMRTKSNEAFKLAQKAAKVKHSISTLEAENDAKVSELLAKISGKKAETVQIETENEAKLSELNALVSARVTEIARAKAENEAKLSQLTNKAVSTKSKIAGIEANKEKAIKEKINKIATMRAQSKAKEQQIANLDQRISDVRKEIDRISKNTDLLIEQRNRFLSSAKKDDTILASVMYTNTIQQNIGYLNTLRSDINSTNHLIFQERVGIETLVNQISDLNAEMENIEKQAKYSVQDLKSDLEDLDAQKENAIHQVMSRVENLQAEIMDLEAQREISAKQTRSKIENMKAEIKDLEAQKESLIKQTHYKVETMQSEIKDLESERELILQEIKSIEFKKKNIENVQIIKPPQVSLGPVKPKTRLNVLLAGVVGLFLTVFLAFFVEYISKYRKRETDE